MQLINWYDMQEIVVYSSTCRRVHYQVDDMHILHAYVREHGGRGQEGSSCFNDDYWLAAWLAV